MQAMPASGNTCCMALRQVIPRLILIIAYIVYLLFGGLVFSMIEGPRYEELVAEEQYDIEHARKLLIHAYEAYGNTTTETDKDEVLDKLTTLVYAAEHPGLMKGPHNVTVMIGQEWTFGNAVLFCMTTISTIGYGHLVPHTLIGSFLTIMYSSIGIPLTILLLADLGRLSAISFMKTFNKCAKKFCKCGRKRGLERQNSIRRKSHDPTGASGSGGIQTNVETDNNRELDLAEVTVAPNEEASLEQLNGADNQQCDDQGVQDCKHQREMDDDELLDDVPIFLPPIIFWSYLILSAPGFGFLEGWSYTSSLYFLYISVTTIGFGDMVPKTTIGIAFAWTGLVVTAMCVALVYRKAIKVASWVLEFLNTLINRDRIRQRDARYSNITL